MVVLLSAAKLADNKFDAVSARDCNRCAPAEYKGNSAGHGAVVCGGGVLLPIGGSPPSCRRVTERVKEGGRERGRGEDGADSEVGNGYTLLLRAACQVTRWSPLPHRLNRRNLDSCP